MDDYLKSKKAEDKYLNRHLYVQIQPILVQTSWQSHITTSFAAVVIRDITERKQMEVELQQALAKVKLLSGLLPICANCKKIRDDEGYWQDVAVYVRDHSEAEFTHAICPDCMKELYPGFHKSDE